MGLTEVDTIEDKSIPTFARGELAHYADINTFHKVPFVRGVLKVVNCDATVLAIPIDWPTTYRPDTRFGPTGVREILALLIPFNSEIRANAREQLMLCDAEDIFTIPANLEKLFDQISRTVSHVLSSGSLPIMIGGVIRSAVPARGIAEFTSKKIGILHSVCYAKIQMKIYTQRYDIKS